MEKEKKTIAIPTAIFAISALTLGIIGGALLGNMFSGEEVDYGDYTAESLEDDNSKLLDKYNKAKGNYDSFTSSELINTSFLLFENETYTSSTSIGEVDAGIVTQSVRATDIKNDDIYFNEAISVSSMKKVANRIIQDDESASLYSGDHISTDHADWDVDSKITMSLEDFEEHNGATLDRTSIYIISSKTILSSSIEKKDNNDYVVSCKLDPIKSVIRYAQQMVTTSGLTKFPTFDYVNLQITLSSSLQLKQIETEEAYTVYMFGYHDSTQTLTETFSVYNEACHIPSFEEDCTYN